MSEAPQVLQAFLKKRRCTLAELNALDVERQAAALEREIAALVARDYHQTLRTSKGPHVSPTSCDPLGGDRPHFAFYPPWRAE